MIEEKIKELKQAEEAKPTREELLKTRRKFLHNLRQELFEISCPTPPISKDYSNKKDHDLFSWFESEQKNAAASKAKASIVIIDGIIDEIDRELRNLKSESTIDSWGW